MSTKIQVKRGTAAQFTSANTVLAEGEPALETDTKKQKIGDGTTAWTALPYLSTGGGITDYAAGAFVVGQLAKSGGLIYECTSAHTGGATIDLAKFRLLNAGPFARTLLLFGDSITANNGAIGTATSPVAANSPASTFGFWTWAAIRLRQGFRVLANKGVGGNTTTQMLARLQTDILSFTPKPGYVVVNGFANDASNGIAVATTISNLISVCDQIRANGSGVILTAALPHGVAGVSSTSQGQVNRALEEYALANPGVIWVDWYSEITDPATGYYANIGMTDDQTHPNVGGASRMGKKLADVLDRAFPGVTGFSFGSNIDAESKISNPGMVGAGGTLGSSPGAIATGWVGRYGANATLSKVARTDGIPGEWQQVAFAGPGSQTGDMYATWAATVGHILQAAVEFEIDTASLPSTTLNGGVTLPTGTVTVASTAGFPTAGTFTVAGQLVTYTGTTGTTFTGCTGGSGTLITGAAITALSDFSLVLADSTGTGVLASCLRDAGNSKIGSGSPLLPSSGVLLTQPVAATTTTGFLFLKFGSSIGTVRWGRAYLKRVA